MHARALVKRATRGADMELSDLISLRTHLADPAYDEPNVRMRVKYLGTHAPASTVVCCRLLEPAWKLEMEAMAAKSCSELVRDTSQDVPPACAIGRPGRTARALV